MCVSIEQIKEEYRRKEEIRKLYEDMKIGLDYCHEQILYQLMILQLEYARWMYEVGKESCVLDKKG